MYTHSHPQLQLTPPINVNDRCDIFVSLVKDKILRSLFGRPVGGLLHNPNENLQFFWTIVVLMTHNVHVRTFFLELWATWCVRGCTLHHVSNILTQLSILSTMDLSMTQNLT